MDRIFYRKIAMAAVFLWLAASGLPSAAHAEEYPAGTGTARLGYLTGDVLFYGPDTQEWADAPVNFTFRAGDKVWAGDGSKAEVKFAGGATAWLNYKTEMDILELDTTGGTYHVSLPAGEASFRVKDFSVRKGVFQVDTPVSSVRAYGRALFRVSLTSDGSTLVGVEKGSVEVESSEGITSVRDGDLLEIDSLGNPTVSDLPAPDGWDKWVESRKAVYARRTRSSEYLPEPLRDDAYEFDNGGRWAYESGRGNVWVPTVAAGWSPYSNGRWVWGVDNYDWVSYDPWYTPFHYGRWMWAAPLGWYWIPPVLADAFWSPGYVSWVWGADDVYWVPLGFGEPYIGYGYYGRASINVYKTNRYNIRNVYINSNAPNGVTRMRRHDFEHGGATVSRVSDPTENPFKHKGLHGTNIIARPPVKEIRPTKELMLPRPGSRPSATSLPSKTIERASESTRGRITAKDPKTSAFHPQRKPSVIENIKRVPTTELIQKRPEQRGKTRPTEAVRPVPAAPTATPRVEEKRLERGTGGAVRTAPIEERRGRESAPGAVISPQPRKVSPSTRPETGTSRRQAVPETRPAIKPEVDKPEPRTAAPETIRRPNVSGGRPVAPEVQPKTTPLAPAREKGWREQRMPVERPVEQRNVTPQTRISPAPKAREAAPEPRPVPRQKEAVPESRQKTSEPNKKEAVRPDPQAPETTRKERGMKDEER